MSDVPFGAIVVFGGLFAIMLLIMLEMLKLTRAIRAELYSAVRHMAQEFVALRAAHEAHIAGDSGPLPAIGQNKKRRSTDVEDWVIDSGVGSGVSSGRK